MTTESARSVPNARHTHELPLLTTTNFATTVYGITATTIDPDDVTAAGTADTISRSDHQHQFTCGVAAALTKTATAAEGSATSAARSDHVHATSALPWGLVATPFDATANDGPYSATSTTDMVLNNVPVIINHWYAVHIHTQLSLAGTGVWVLDLLVNGVAYDRMWRIDQTDPVIMADATVLWQAPATASTDDFAVRATETTDGASLTLQAGTDRHRWLSISDLGSP